jgi:flagellar hook-associated protein 1 FlgK
MPPTVGKIAANTEIRDQLASVYQSQLDEIARGLVVLFAEKDASASPSLPDATGLFSYSGSPAVPAAAVVIPGLARSISLNAAFDPASGGNPMLIRDGGANGAAYRSNATNAPSFQDRITALISALDSTMSFAPGTGLPETASVKSLAQSSAGWVESLRAEASRKSEFLNALTTKSREALSRAIGVNMDDEMAELLNLERSYQASAKVIGIVNEMFNSLFEAVR